MADSNFLINVSVLYRNVQKYLDKELAKFSIGSGQLMFLLFINENEGVTMQEVTRIVEVDKGTTTKSIQKLIEQGYVQSRIDENDRRVKRLYTTERTSEVMAALYECRNQLRVLLTKDMDFELFEQLLSRACDNTRSELSDTASASMLRIGELKKMSLLDYPGIMSASVMLAGCPFKCPFCHNRDLVFLPENFSYVDPDELIEFLEERKGILDGIFIGGGEPLLQDGLLPFIRKARDMGYRIKVNTNGYHPGRLKELIDAGLADVISLDIKNRKEKYAETVGLNQDVFRIENIEESIRLLRESTIPHEFTTTVVKEYHDEEDLLACAGWIGRNEKYILEQYHESEKAIQPGLHPYDEETMKAFVEAVREIVPDAHLRGIRRG